MKNSRILIFFGIIIFSLFSMASVSAINASSSNYSIGMFGTGILSESPNSSNYTSDILTEAQGTTRNAYIPGYTINRGFFKGTIPHQTVSIDSYSIYPASAVQNSIISFQISATNAQATWLKLTLPNSTQQIISLTNEVYSYYTADLVGTYDVAFYANSSTSSISIVLDDFEITSPPSPTPPPSSGGGTSCNYIWDCGSWSVCSSDGIQTRTCKNVGTCTGETGKPIEERNCSESLFDVKLKLDKLELNEQDKLEFGVDLTQTKNTDKIDVQIRYYLIDKENNEIFSQVETRAIETNLSYREELEELFLENGEYTLGVEIIYGELQRAMAEQGFVVKEAEVQEVEKSRILEVKPKTKFYNYLIILGIALILLLLILIIKNKNKSDVDIILRKGKKEISKGNVKEALDLYPALKTLYNEKYKGEEEIYDKIAEYSKILKDSANKKIREIKNGR